jgi:glycosyltransferase involved in cell wall biosynthesis
MKKSVQEAGVVLVGHPFAPIGMGEHVRLTFRALKSVGVEAGIRDIYSLEARDDPDYEQNYGSALQPRLCRGVNIFHINGDEVKQALAHLNDPAFSEAYNIIYPAWELGKYPQVWAKELQRFNEVWAPSQFIADAIVPVVDIPVVHMPLAVDVRLQSFLSRRAFELPEHTFVYLFFFDYSSYMERKNPQALLAAFADLCERHPKAPLHLVLKTKGEPKGKEHRELEAGINRLGRRVQVIQEKLTDNQTKNLIRLADCFVSLHRAEGFGRGLAEAMVLGVPAIATGYSGNLDFMDSNCTELVGFELVPVGEKDYPFATGQCWAAPSVSDAVAAMERIYLNPGMARARAAKAAAKMRTQFSLRASGLRFSQRLREVLELSLS